MTINEMNKHNKTMWELLLSNHSVTSVILYDTYGWADCVGLNTTTNNTRLGYEAIVVNNGINENIKIIKLTKEEFERRYQIDFSL